MIEDDNALLILFPRQTFASVCYYQSICN